MAEHTTRSDTGTPRASPSTADGLPHCPFCGSEDVQRELAFGSALSKSQYSCRSCTTVFERIRWEKRRPTSAHES